MRLVGLAQSFLVADDASDAFVEFWRRNAGEVDGDFVLVFFAVDSLRGLEEDFGFAGAEITD